jgi:hypothetical protein
VLVLYGRALAPENTFKTFASPRAKVCKGCARSQSSDKSGSAIQTLLIVWCNMDDGEFKILNYFLKASHSCSWVNKRSSTGHSGNKFIALVDEKLLSNCREKRKREASSSALWHNARSFGFAAAFYQHLQRYSTFEPFKALWLPAVNNAWWISNPRLPPCELWNGN